MSRKDFHRVAAEIGSSLAGLPGNSRRTSLKALLAAFGVEARRGRWLDAVERSLSDAGIAVSARLNTLGQEDWLELSLGGWLLPFLSGDRESTALSTAQALSGKLLDAVGKGMFRNDEEMRETFVVPLLIDLGYGQQDLAENHPVPLVHGWRTEADFVLFDGPERTREKALLVVEAKKVARALADLILPARSYAVSLGATQYLVTNGDSIVVFCRDGSANLDRPVFRGWRRDLHLTFSSLYNLIGRHAMVAERRRRSPL